MQFSRKDRDLIDYFTIFISSLALFGVYYFNISSKEETIPKVSLYLRNLGPVYLENNLSLQHQIKYSFSNYSPATLGIDVFANLIEWQLKYYKYEVTIINNKNVPISLRKLQAVDIKYEVFREDIFPQFYFICQINDSLNNLANDPILNIAPNESKKITLLIAFIIYPSINYEKDLQNVSFDYLTKIVTPPIKPNPMKDFKFSIENGTPYSIEQMLAQQSPPFIHREVYKNFLSKVFIKNFRLSAMDNLNQIYLSE